MGKVKEMNECRRTSVISANTCDMMHINMGQQRSDVGVCSNIGKDASYNRRIKGPYHQGGGRPNE